MSTTMSAVATQLESQAARELRERREKILINSIAELRNAWSTNGRHKAFQNLWMVTAGKYHAWVFDCGTPPNRAVITIGTPTNPYAKKDEQVEGMTWEQAKDRARALRKAMKAGDLEKAIKEGEKRDLKRNSTYEADAARYFEKKKSGMAKMTAYGWWQQQRAYVFPFLGDKVTSSLTQEDIEQTLKRIWIEKHPTAREILPRISAVWKKAQYDRKEEFKGVMNPAEGVVENGLPEVRYEGKNHPSIPFRQAPDVYAELCQDDCMQSRMIRLILLTGSPRWAEIRKARWEQFVTNEVTGEKVLRISKHNLKNGWRTGKGRDLPLCAEALEILRKQKEACKGLRPPYSYYIFPSPKNLSRTGYVNIVYLVQYLDRRNGLTYAIRSSPDFRREDWPKPWDVHGLRATVRSWATSKYAKLDRYESEAVGANQDRMVHGEVRLRYEHDGLIEERHDVLVKWAEYLTSKVQKTH